jgi:hypothetical protein
LFGGKRGEKVIKLVYFVNSLPVFERIGGRFLQKQKKAEKAAAVLRFGSVG